ncbi:MAG TPA: excinuclease ABC subunit UvrC [bacterium (Candidatus Stahlbacteria)]|nr:excinuclease ABC subunit UvrC [Candidatus Stahlbacteria bacterium]
MRGEIRARIERAPSYPGVYIFRGKGRSPLYIGKATDLKNRLKSYLNPTDPKTEKIVRYATELEYIITNSDTEALTLEESLIKLNKPRYNVRLKDDKKYPYLKLTIQNRFPGLYLTRNLKKDGSLLFGPYTSARSLRRTVQTVARIFKLRSCRKKIPSEDLNRPCLNFHMKRCLAPCQGDIPEEEYNRIVQNVIQFLTGKSEELEKRVEGMMFAAAADEKFELAARYRDQLKALREVKRRQTVVTSDGIDRDIIGVATGPRTAVAVIFKIRENGLIGRETYRIEKTSGTSTRELNASILRMLYTHLSFLPDEIVLQERPDDVDVFMRWTLEHRRQKVRVRSDPRGERRYLLKWATRNAELELERITTEKPVPKALLDLMEKLRLDKVPIWIEAFDISNLKGSYATGSSIAFINGMPRKSLYRRYRIRTVQGIDDYAMIQEVVSRRIKDLGPDLPDLLLIDGGKGQVRSAEEVLNRAGIKIPVFGLAKRFDHLFQPGGRMLSIQHHSPALKLLKRIRDEAHRFAINYHKRLRRKRLRRKSLENLPGIGPRRATILYQYFQDLDRIQRASEEELRSVPGIGKELARSIYQALHT